MPMDATGSYRHNHESAQMHSEAAGKKYNTGGDHADEDNSGDHVEIHSHGDGTFHTLHQGEKVEHPTHGHALIHAAAVHAEEGHKHFHAHHDGEALHTHSHKGGEEEEHRDHAPEDTEGANEHLDETMGEGADHSENPEEEEQPAGAGLGGLY